MATPGSSKVRQKSGTGGLSQAKLAMVEPEKGVILGRALWTLAELKFDIDRLRAELLEVRQRLAPQMVTPEYGGWTLLSSNGDYRDGWLKPGASIGEKVKSEDSAEEFALKQRAVGLQPSSSYCVPTQAYVPYFREINEKFSEQGVLLLRARLAMLKAGASTEWHRDAPLGLDDRRLHIALETNPKCFFEWPDFRLHCPADGSAWYLRVDIPHRACNGGESDRYHIIANISVL